MSTYGDRFLRLPCSVCGALVLRVRDRRQEAVICSGACKAKAYRMRHAPRVPKRGRLTVQEQAERLIDGSLDRGSKEADALALRMIAEVQRKVVAERDATNRKNGCCRHWIVDADGDE